MMEYFIILETATANGTTVEFSSGATFVATLAAFDITPPSPDVRLIVTFWSSVLVRKFINICTALAVDGTEKGLAERSTFVRLTLPDAPVEAAIDCIFSVYVGIAAAAAAATACMAKNNWLRAVPSRVIPAPSMALIISLVVA